MTIQHDQIPAYWNYFLALEEDVNGLSRWIEFSPDNESVYSIELARLLMTAAAEADVVAKALCKRIDPTSKASNITAYKALLLNAAPMLPEASVSVPRFGMTFRPWSNWIEGKAPDWRTGNNNVKHHRAEHFKSANLKNVLNAVAGLLVLLLLYYSADGPFIYPVPRIYVPISFGVLEAGAIRLMIPDGTHFPWA